MHDVIFTTGISEEASLQASVLGLRIHQVPFTETIVRSHDTWNIPVSPAPWIFTSKKAVKAVCSHPHFSESIIPPVTYAVGNATAAMLSGYGFKNIVTGDKDAITLSGLVKENKVYFFCGDQRRDELVMTLSGKGVEVKEIICYDTRKIVPELPLPAAEMIAFMSPLAVESFVNVLHVHDIPVFAIGETTADALRKYNFSHIYTAPKPSVTALIQMISEHAGNKK